MVRKYIRFDKRLLIIYLSGQLEMYSAKVIGMQRYDEEYLLKLTSLLKYYYILP